MTEKEKKIREAILNGLIDCRDAPDLGWSNFGGIHIDDCIAQFKKQDEPKLHWISVEDSLPYEYPELLGLDATVPVLTKTEWLGYFVQYMYYDERKWQFSEGGGVSHWMSIPEPPKE